MTNQEIKQYWCLYEKAMQENLLSELDRKWCDFCKKVIKLPEKSQSSEHWRWMKKDKCYRCKEKDKYHRNKSNYKIRNTLEGFLKRKYETIKHRCTNPNNNRYKLYKGYLKMTWEEFFTWGKETLIPFKENQGLSSLYNQGIQINRVKDTGYYEIENIQWVKK